MLKSDYFFKNKEQSSNSQIKSDSTDLLIEKKTIIYKNNKQ